MSTTPWEEFAKRGRELYERQAELAKTWLDGQSTLAGAFAETGEGGAPAGLGADAAAMAEWWRSWLGLGTSLGAAMPGMAQPGQVAGEALGRFLDPMSLLLASGSQVGETIRKMTEGPRLADLGAVERRMGKVMQLWLQVQQAARAYEAVAAGAWHEASQRFATEYQKLARAGQAPSQPSEALKLWLEIANRTLLETHRSEPFLAAQGELLRHGMTFLLAEREMVESMVEPAGLPTRTEVDEVHRSVQELKRRVRALEKAGAGADPPQRPASPRRAPARKAAARHEGTRA
jgi:polyhydroxyalkanoate synthase subunit PhaE